MSGPPPPPPGLFTHRVERSPLLDRLQAFLPQLKAANEQLEQDIKTHGAEKYCFEDTTGCENPIRLQLSIGVLEPQKIDPEEEAKRAKNAEMNPTNLAILPSELEQKKKEDGTGELVMPWDVKTNPVTMGTDPTKPSTGSKMVTVVDEDAEMGQGQNEKEEEEEDGHEEKGDGMGEIKIKRQRLSTNPITDEADANTESDLPLLGSPTQPNEDFSIENESMALGSHLFNEEDPVISTAEAVKILHALGYEAVGNISAANQYVTAEEIENEMKDE